MGGPWEVLGGSLGGPWGVLGGPWGILGVSLGVLGGILGGPWGATGPHRGPHNGAQETAREARDGPAGKRGISVQLIMACDTAGAMKNSVFFRARHFGHLSPGGVRGSPVNKDGSSPWTLAVRI